VADISEEPATPTSILKTEAVGSSETSVTSCQTTWCHNLENSNPNLHSCTVQANGAVM
jgi:hypothetical protein